MAAGFFGGPANHYSENTGVLAATKNYNPCLKVDSFVCHNPWLLANLVRSSNHKSGKGGIELVLFGMIAAIVIRTLAESDTDMSGSEISSSYP